MDTLVRMTYAHEPPDESGFLLKAEARTLSLVEVLCISDDDAFTLFRRVPWVSLR